MKKSENEHPILVTTEVELETADGIHRELIRTTVREESLAEAVKDSVKRLGNDWDTNEVFDLLEQEGKIHVLTPDLVTVRL